MSKLQNNIASLEALIVKANALPEAKTLDILDNPGSAATMLEGTEMLDAEGKKVAGTIETKTSSNLTASGETVTVPAGYYAEDATKNVEEGALGVPTIHVNSSGLITAFTELEASGYIDGSSAGVGESSTKQLTTQAAKTVTPTKSSQTAVAAGRYTTGAVTVAAIPAAYQDVTGVTVTSATTLTGSSFVDSDGTLTAGSMPNNGDTSQTFDGLETTSVTIPEGYTSGGTVALDSTISDTADSQADLIEQISAALAGKSVPGGSGGSGSVETCTVTIDNNYMSYAFDMYYEAVENGQIVRTKISNGTDVTFTPVKGSRIVLIDFSDGYALHCAGEVSIEYEAAVAMGIVVYLFAIDGDGAITFY